MTPAAHPMFRYHGLSMWPCFQDGDLLELERVSFAKIRVGDCIAYRTIDGQHAVHRVTKKNQRLTTRGDALSAVDREPVQAHQVLGRVIRRHRFGRGRSVARGICGRIAGPFYRYAGRIDPQRNSRGGRLARTIQTLSAIGLKPLWRKGRTRRLVRQGEDDLIVWMLGKTAIGRQSSHPQEWTIAWPWTVLIRRPE